MRVTVKLEATRVLAQFRLWGQKADSTVENWLYQTGERMVKAAQANAPVRSGFYRKSIFYETRGVKEVRVSSTAPYAAIIESGSRPHEIRAKSGKMLRFTAGGQVIFTRRVQHPGTQPRRVLQNALESQRGQALTTLGNMIKSNLGIK